MDKFELGLFVIVICIVSTVGSSNLTDSAILAFNAPAEIKNKLPYYLSGYDEDGAPIWIIEAGKWDMRKYVEKGGTLYDAMDIFTDQMYLTFRDSGLNSTGKQFLGIMDMDGFNIRQVKHLKTVQFMISKFGRFEQITRNGSLKQGWVLNANVLFERIWQLGSPLLGQIASHIEVFGTNAEKWKPQLLKHLPRDQLPEWYGGSPNHKPLKVFG